jgi:hypothetical protein
MEQWNFSCLDMSYWEAANNYLLCFLVFCLEVLIDSYTCRCQVEYDLDKERRDNESILNLTFQILRLA